MKHLSVILFGAILILSGCAQINKDEDKPVTTESNSIDSHTYSNFNEIRTVHLHLDLEVNFKNNTIYGVARHEMNKHNSDKAIFDIKGLEIQKVTLGKDQEKNTDFVIGKNDELIGQSLTVSVNEDTKYINIYYQTTEKTEALDWLPPELTAGKKHPYMYTQGQAILTRSWIPIQDTPMNRITYSADVQVPHGLMAVMSASNPVKKHPKGRYHFEMNQRIPAYLIALAVGDMTYTPLGNKCGVYSEPEMAEAAAYEFVDVPKMMEVAENMYGDYQWDQYDIVILPYSFPFGGMENPRLTFANPTIIAGDRSLVSVIAHELAHSWSGNLVTNATWNDFWLNEGFTVYFEHRIMEEIYGKETADILAIISYQELEVALEDIENSDHPEDSQLKLQLEGRNPDDGMTDIAYVKGAFFLRTLESIVGREKFDKFLSKYFTEHAFKTITTENFITYLDENLLIPNDLEFDAKEWIYKPGIPENCIKVTSTRLDEMKTIAMELNSGEASIPSAFKNKKRDDFITQEWQAFIRGIEPSVNVSALKQLDNQFEFSDAANPAIQSEWFQLAIRAGYKEARPAMKKYLCKIGRRWFIEGVYITMMESIDKSDHAFAKEVFEEAKMNYHFVSRATIEEIIYEEESIE
jgi:aminopeptidase N